MTDPFGLLEAAFALVNSPACARLRPNRRCRKSRLPRLLRTRSRLLRPSDEVLVIPRLQVTQALLLCKQAPDVRANWHSSILAMTGSSATLSTIRMSCSIRSKHLLGKPGLIHRPAVLTDSGLFHFRQGEIVGVKQGPGTTGRTLGRILRGIFAWGNIVGCLQVAVHDIAPRRTW